MSNDRKLTQAEADKMLNMLKKTLLEEIEFPSKGKSISLGTSAWQPNERIIGIYDIHRTQKRGGWYLTYNTLVTSQNTIHLSGTHKVGEERPLNIPFYKAQSLSSQTAAMANIFSHRGTSIAIGRTINDT